jgi:uncharacterized membrane protein YcaP (DUF421 family)
MEIVFRAAVVFGFLWLVTRVVGKQQLGQMNAFELLLLVTMGDLVQQGITQEDYSVTGSLLAVATFAVLGTTMSYVSWRFPRTRPALEGLPTILIRDGHVLDDVLRYERLPVEELFEAMREQGIRSVRDVDVAVLEPDGSYSFFRAGGRAGGGSEPEGGPQDAGTRAGDHQPAT